MQSMIVLGETHQGCELIRDNDGQVVGVRTASREFHFVTPLFDEEGNCPPEIPLFPPAEIRTVTHEPPDLTAKHPDTVKAAWLKAPSKLRNLTLRQYCSCAHAREAVWEAHGTDELASFAGYIWHWPEDSTKASVAQSVAWRIAKRLSGPDVDAAYNLIRRARFIVIYDDGPKCSRVFLEGLHTCDRSEQQPVSNVRREESPVSNETVRTDRAAAEAPILANLEKANSSTPPSPWMRRKEVCMHCRICATTLTNWMRDGLIRYYTTGRTVRFNRAEVDEDMKKLKK